MSEKPIWTNNTERCNSCQWFDSERGVCDHCAFGHPYVDQNGLTPNEVAKCDIYYYDERIDYEWQWNVKNKILDEWDITAHQSKPDDMNWIKLEHTKRRKQ